MLRLGRTLMMRVEGKGPTVEETVTLRHGTGKRRRRAVGGSVKRIGGERERGESTINVNRTEGDEVNPSQSTTQTSGGRVLRSRRYRRPFEDKPIKRLFTPEIKRFLKGWLVRRRENPYPSREEKKELSRQTALTYVQICNWFANWRRKLKNAAEEANLCKGRNQDSDDLEQPVRSDERTRGGGGRRRRRTWGNLIRRYNSRAQGNVEQFSITSDDSIWEEPEENVDIEEEEERGRRDGRRISEDEDGSSCDDSRGSEEEWATMDHSYSILPDRTKCRHRFPTPPSEEADRMEGVVVDTRGSGKSFRVRSSAYPSGCRKGSYDATSSDDENSDGDDCDNIRRNAGVKRACPGGSHFGGAVSKRGKCIGGNGAKCSSAVTKWIESACAFEERKRNYSSGDGAVQVKWATRNVMWSTGDNSKVDDKAPWMLPKIGVETNSTNSCHWPAAGRHREELDAAETLALLAATALP